MKPLTRRLDHFAVRQPVVAASIDITKAGADNVLRVKVAYLGLSTQVAILREFTAEKEASNKQARQDEHASHI